MNESYAENLIFGKFILFPEFTNMAQSCHINYHNKVEDGIDEELANRLGGSGVGSSVTTLNQNKYYNPLTSKKCP